MVREIPGRIKPTRQLFTLASWHEDAVTWLIRKRQINAIGVNSASLDYGQSKAYPCHTVMGKNNIVGIEHVGNLDSIPESEVRFTFRF